MIRLIIQSIAIIGAAAALTAVVFIGTEQPRYEYVAATHQGVKMATSTTTATTTSPEHATAGEGDASASGNSSTPQTTEEPEVEPTEEIIEEEALLEPVVVEEPEPTPEPIEEEQEFTYTRITDTECETYLQNSHFYLDPHAVKVQREKIQRDEGNIETADLLREVSCFPQGIWLTWQDPLAMRDRVENITADAVAVDKIPVFVIYNSPDHGSVKWWVGNQGTDYLYWIEQVARGAGDNEVWFVLEPDAIGLSTDYSEEDKLYRYNELKLAVERIKEYAPNSRVYLDSGHNQWKSPERFADILNQAGIEQADGFALNISNYQLLEDEIAFGKEISRLVGNKPFIIDTARNGNGAPTDNHWCNALGRALGERPTTDTGESLVNAFFWIKPPGESDGSGSNCHNGPTPGQFWLEYTLDLIREAIKNRKY